MGINMRIHKLRWPPASEATNASAASGGQPTRRLDTCVPNSMRLVFPSHRMARVTAQTNSQAIGKSHQKPLCSQDGLQTHTTRQAACRRLGKLASKTPSIASSAACCSRNASQQFQLASRADRHLILWASRTLSHFSRKAAGLSQIAPKTWHFSALAPW